MMRHISFMDRQDYPALYIDADSASDAAQSKLLNLQKWTAFTLVVGACLALYDGENRVVLGLAAVVFLSSLVCVLLGHFQKLQSKWYKSRALAESIKTASWRFMMGAKPFNGKSQSEISLFADLLSELLKENKDIGLDLTTGASDQDQITSYMTEVRLTSHQKRKDIYLQSRIDQQRSWYKDKAAKSVDASQCWILIVSLLYLGAICCLIARIIFPSLKWLPTEALAVAASCVLGWMQIKRFDEQAAAYSLTSHEIGIIKTQFQSVNSAEDLGKFVEDAENAFSREHTQWAARRDYL